MISSARALSHPGRNLIAATLLALSAACSKDATSIASPVKSEPLVVNPPLTATIAFNSFPNPIDGASFWVDPTSNARLTAETWYATNPDDAAQMEKIASEGMAKWIGNWTRNVEAAVDAMTTTMTDAGALPVFVAYNIPQRDCGGLSGGNGMTAQGYQDWITAFATGIGSRRAVVILEPDALAAMDCLSIPDQNLRLSLINFAVETFAAQGNIAVYLDGGHPRWKSAGTMAARLVNAGVAQATGFSLNVSNFFLTSENVAYGTQVASLIGGKHFIIDTSRNGLGPAANNQWCNPDGRALGDRPTTATGNALVDAYLWVKTPGESDGSCDGNPTAGAWMPQYALGLAQRAAY